MSFGRRLITASALIFASRMMGAAIILGVQVLIARRLGSDALGTYAVAQSATNIAAMCLPLGFQTIATYFAAAYGARGQGQALRAFLSQAGGQIAAMSLALVVILPFTLLHAGAALRALEPVWGAVVLSALALASLGLSGSTLTALKHPLLGYMGDALVRPALTAGALLFTLSANTRDAILSFLWHQSFGFAALAAVYVAILWQRARLVPRGAANLRLERRQWWFFALPWVIIALASDFFFDLDVLLLTRYLTIADLAVFGIACRLFALAGFAVSAIYAVSLPDVFEAEAKGERSLFMGRIVTINRFAALLSIIILAGAAFVAPLILPVLGSDFARAASPLALLCLILPVRAVFGPAALILSIARKPYTPLLAVGLSLGVLLVANAVLVPPFGLLGACASAVAATWAWCFTMWALARRFTGLDVSLLARGISGPTGA